jgi:hypothetical protein
MYLETVITTAVPIIEQRYVVPYSGNRIYEQNFVFLLQVSALCKIRYSSCSIVGITLVANVPQCIYVI